jgi:hypothetical protein
VPVISVEPGASADEHAPDKPIRSIVAIWRAGKRIVVIISVGTDRRRAIVSRTVVGIVGRPYSKTDYHSLRTRKRRAEEANAEHSRNP